MAVFATLADVKRHLGKTATVDDDELQDMLDAATERVQSLIGTSFDAVAVTERVAVHGGTVVLSRRPAAGSVTLNGGGITGFTVNAAAGLLYDVYPGGAYPVTATYTAAASTVPASVQLATAIIAAHLWETQRGPAGPVGGPLQEPGSDQPFGNGAGFAIPNRAKELLDPFVREPQAL